jgi:hypothetical protein
LVVDGREMSFEFFVIPKRSDEFVLCHPEAMNLFFVIPKRSDEFVLCHPEAKR